MTLIQNFNHFSLLLPLSAPPPFSSSPLSISLGMGFCFYKSSITLNISQKHFFFSARIHTHYWCSHGSVFTLILSQFSHLSSSVLCLCPSFFLFCNHLNLLFSYECSSLPHTSAHSFFLITAEYFSFAFDLNRPSLHPLLLFLTHISYSHVAAFRMIPRMHLKQVLKGFNSSSIFNAAWMG